MNDALSGQLTSQWTIPVYARGQLWIETHAGAVVAEGARGLFTLPEPADELFVRWGGAQGPLIACLRWQPDSLEWDGTIRIGGYIDALHIGEIASLPEPVVVLHIGGVPLKPGVTAFPTLKDRAHVPYPVPSFSDGLADAPESVTTWAALEGAAPLTLAQDALVSKMRVYAFGRLAEAIWGWHELFALPIALEGMTLFGS